MSYSTTCRKPLARLSAMVQQATEFIYDSSDLVQIKDPLNRSMSFFYDVAGRIRRISDASGNGTLYDYDVLNQITKITEALGAVTEFTYDANGNLLTLKDGRNQTTTFTYDNMDRVLTRVDSLQSGSSTESFEYDVKGNPIKSTDRRGKVTTTTYDALDRPIFVGFGANYSPTAQRFISEDSIDFESGDTNLYAYVSNGPCNYSDASGNYVLMGCALGVLYTFYFDAWLAERLPGATL